MAPMTRSICPRVRRIMVCQMRSRAKASSPTSMGLKRAMSAAASVSAEPSADPRNEYPSAPPSATMRTNAICVLRLPELAMVRV